MLRRKPPYPQGDEQFVSERVLEMAERVLNNLQKGIVDSTISIATGLEEGSSYSGPSQALPYYHQPTSHLPRYFNQNSIETKESSSNYRISEYGI